MEYSLAESKMSEEFVPKIVSFEEDKTAKQKVSSETLIYTAVGIVALVALVFFFKFFIFTGTTNVIEPTVTLEIEYSIELEDGTVIASGNDSFTEGSVGSSFGFSDKVDDLIAGLSKGEEGSVTLDIQDAFGELDDEKVIEVNRTEKLERKSEIEREIILTIGQFKQEFNEEPLMGMSYSIEGVPWRYSVVFVDGDNITVSQEIEVGQTLPISDLFFMVVTEITSDKIVTMLSADEQVLETDNGNITIKVEEEFILMTLTPEVGQQVVLGISPSPATVVSFNDEKIVLDYNPEFAGEKIVFKAKLIEN